MLKRMILAVCILIVPGSKVRAESLDLPPRASTALTGLVFARSIVDLPLIDREAKIVAEVKSGNVPAIFRTLLPVSVSLGSSNATYQVTADYLAVGSDDDYVLMPLTPRSAQEIADCLGCILPTTKMVDDIYAASTVKLTPMPIPPSPSMTTIPVFLRHDEMIRDHRKIDPSLGLVAGHKKDVVIANKVFATPGKVAIYGWHRAVGQPIQPLYTGHSASWVDYSHGVRLVRRRLVVDGEPKSVEEVLADPRLAPLLSHEGVMTRTCYGGSARTIESVSLDRGVRVVIDRAETVFSKPVLLVFYALPNGNSIEQTMGKAVGPGDDWHFDIQQIAAQTRFLRETIRDRELVVAYLENDLKSWPTWRKQHGDSAIPAILDAVRSRFDAGTTRVVLAGHSGGGSLIFGYLNGLETIPDQVERIAFLDANYAYETGWHLEKLATWLRSSDRHFLCVLAYHDDIALLNGKTFVSESGGTWGRSRVMLADLGGLFPIARSTEGALERANALGGRVAFLLKENPDRKILHTVQVERNGFIEAILSGTKDQGIGYVYLGERAYSRFLKGD